MDIACFIPLHFHYQDSGHLALPRTDWHCPDTCLLVDSPSTALSSKPSKKRSIDQQTSSFEYSRKKRPCHQPSIMLPRRRSTTTASNRPTTNRRRSSQQHQQLQSSGTGGSGGASSSSSNNNNSSSARQQQQSSSQQLHRRQQSVIQRQPLQQQTSSSSLSSNVSQDVATVTSIEDDLHHLRDEWATIDIVFHSLRNAFTIQPLETATEEHLDDVDRELSIAYDDLKAQVRHLERSLRRLDDEISTFRSPQTPANVTTTIASSSSSPSTPKTKSTKSTSTTTTTTTITTNTSMTTTPNTLSKQS